MQALAGSLSVTAEALHTAFARLLELSRTSTALCGENLLGCLEVAVAKFGAELMQVLVAELNISGLEADGSISADPAMLTILLEYSPATANNAAKEASACNDTCPCADTEIQSAMFASGPRGLPTESHPVWTMPLAAWASSVPIVLGLFALLLKAGAHTATDRPPRYAPRARQSPRPSPLWLLLLILLFLLFLLFLLLCLCVCVFVLVSVSGGVG